ncbi:unnamed protein product [Closterium sp. Naga37s-1]|nr:unnamed protein product [Closterium sp. Naga37s-1]
MPRAVGTLEWRSRANAAAGPSIEARPAEEEVRMAVVVPPLAPPAPSSPSAPSPAPREATPSPLSAPPPAPPAPSQELVLAYFCLFPVPPSPLPHSPFPPTPLTPPPPPLPLPKPPPLPPPPLFPPLVRMRSPWCSSPSPCAPPSSSPQSPHSPSSPSRGTGFLLPTPSFHDVAAAVADVPMDAGDVDDDDAALDGSGGNDIVTCGSDSSTN